MQILSFVGWGRIYFGNQEALGLSRSDWLRTEIVSAAGGLQWKTCKHAEISRILRFSLEVGLWIKNNSTLVLRAYVKMANIWIILTTICQVPQKY
jgi:hypothetical protein